MLPSECDVHREQITKSSHFYTVSGDKSFIVLAFSPSQNRERGKLLRSLRATQSIEDFARHGGAGVGTPSVHSGGLSQRPPPLFLWRTSGVAAHVLFERSAKQNQLAGLEVLLDSPEMLLHEIPRNNPKVRWRYNEQRGKIACASLRVKHWTEQLKLLLVLIVRAACITSLLRPSLEQVTRIKWASNWPVLSHNQAESTG